MQIFVTGATGWVGRHVVKQLQSKGHTVTGLSRSAKSAAALTSAGVTPVQGDLESLDAIKKAAAESDGVIHCGFIHDFSKYVENCVIDTAVITAIGSALEGTNKPFIVTSGTATVGKVPGDMATELDRPAQGHNPRYRSELLTYALADKGVRAMVIRLPPSVHGNGDYAFVPMIIQAARRNKQSPYIGEGNNRWPSVHVADAASLYVLALEKGKAGSTYHATHDCAIPTRDIATAIGKGAGIPVLSLRSGSAEAKEHFGFLEMFFGGVDNATSSEITRRELGWEPTQSTLLENLNEGTYFD
ncbi:NAD-dependent epimerase/dehydratase [Meredithblackwellia eburnea MCA 4105]